jgi:heavy metal sensor kinase
MFSWTSSLRFRITQLYVVVFGVILFLFTAILYLGYQRRQAQDFDKFLYNRVLSIARSISIDVSGRLEIDQALIAETGRWFPFQFGDEYIEVRSSEGRSIARSNNLAHRSLPLTRDMLADLQQGRFLYLTLSGAGEAPPFWNQGDLRLLSMPLVSQGQVQLVVQLGMSTYAHDQAMLRLKTALFFVAVPLTLLLAGFGGWWIVGRAFLPVNQIISAAQRMSSERLAERLPVGEVDDELRRLSLTLNEMLDRLENAFKSQQRFVADASHELKTPITILQGELDVLRQQPRSNEEYQEFLGSASEELQRLSQIIQNLLLLARADSGRPLEMKEEVRLDEVVLEVVERLQSFAKEHQVKLTVKMQEDDEDESWCSLRGDHDLLVSLFFNLVHNAIKYSAAGQNVEIELLKSEAGPCVQVRDYGTGIRAEDLPHLFERFYRAENPARRDVSGTGLGLAIVKWIADVHGAKVAVESKPAEGSVFRVTFCGRQSGVRKIEG